MYVAVCIDHCTPIIRTSSVDISIKFMFTFPISSRRIFARFCRIYAHTLTNQRLLKKTKSYGGAEQFPCESVVLRMFVRAFSMNESKIETSNSLFQERRVQKQTFSEVIGNFHSTSSSLVERAKCNQIYCACLCG